MRLTGAWADHAEFIQANYSPGIPDVWMSLPAFARSIESQIAHHNPRTP